MKRLGIAAVIAVFCFVTAAPSQQRRYILPREFEKHGFPITVPQKKPNSSVERFRTPSVTPGSGIDYKILRLGADPSIDYKILDTAPRTILSDALKLFKQRILPPLFNYPGSVIDPNGLPPSKNRDSTTENKLK